MQAKPIKKFEKIISETRDSGQVVLYKVTDYQYNITYYEVSDDGKKTIFKTLKEARDHIQQRPVESPRPLFRMEARQV